MGVLSHNPSEVLNWAKLRLNDQSFYISGLIESFGLAHKGINGSNELAMPSQVGEIISNAIIYLSLLSSRLLRNCHYSGGVEV